MIKVFTILSHVIKIAIASGIVLFLVPFIEPISLFSYFFLGGFSYFMVDLAYEVWILVVRVNIILKNKFF